MFFSLKLYIEYLCPFEVSFNQDKRPNAKGQAAIVSSFAFWFGESSEEPLGILPGGCSSPCLLRAVLISLLLAISDGG